MQTLSLVLEEDVSSTPKSKSVTTTPENERAILLQCQSMEHSANTLYCIMDSKYGTIDQSEFSVIEAILQGHFFAIIVLRALCAERALKLSKLLERNGKHKNVHDLWRLYDHLGEATKASIGTGKYLSRAQIEEVLQVNRHNFNEWRYAFECDGTMSTQFNLMKNATRQILEWCEARLGKKISSFSSVDHDPE